MGDEGVHDKATQQEVGYSVIGIHPTLLPDSYRNMIYSKWLRSLRFGNDYFKLINPAAYYDAYNKYIQRIMAQPKTMVRVAVLNDDYDVALGFSVSRGNILDYVHVHRDNRFLGIGTKLVPNGIDTITHLTKTGMVIWANKYGHWAFNPFA